MADTNAPKNTDTDIGALLSTEESKAVQREAMLLRVRERHTLQESVKTGKRKGNSVCNRAMDPTDGQTDTQIIALALKGA